MNILVIFIITWLVSVHASPLPNKLSQCGNVKLSETVLPSRQIDDSQLIFVSDNNQIVFVRTTDGQVYRSADEGITWTIQTVDEILPGISGGSIERIYHTETTNVTLYLHGRDNLYNEKIWVSRNGGVSYELITTSPSKIERLYLNPTNPDLILLTTTNNELYLGENYGSMWRKLTDLNFVKLSWSVFSNINPNRIYVLEMKKTIIYSDDFFNTTSTIPLQNTFSFLMIAPNRFIAATCASSTDCSGKFLHISEDGGASFSTADFPNKRNALSIKDFWVPEITDDTIWVHITRSCSNNNLCWGDMYHSNDADKDFTLSLSYQRNYDFTKYQSVDGIYIANQYNTLNDIPKEGDKIRSLITFDKGSEWSLLKAPELDSNGQPTDCKLEKQCSLHVHGWGSYAMQFTYFYSIPNAIGLMIATGNLGDALSTDENDMNTYISFNGGVTWNEVVSGSWVPEIGDHGSVIVLAPKSSTNTLKYTINDGVDWMDCVFTDEQMMVTNIRVSQGWDSRRFILYGQNINSTFNATLVHINFDDAFSRKCNATDFEPWTPRDEHDQCVLGRATTYSRRKSGVSCYFGEEHEPETTTTNCNCTKVDYECDFCFYRADLGSLCELECYMDKVPPKPSWCVNSTATNPMYYSVPMGYRLIEGDSCINPHETVSEGIVSCEFPFPSPATPESSEYGVLPILIGVVIFLAVVIVALVFLWKKNEAFHNCVASALGIGEVEMLPYGGVAGESLAENVELDEEVESSKEDST